jgi:hypothetical protein
VRRSNTVPRGTTPFGTGRYAKLIPEHPQYDAHVDQLRVAIASVALLVPSVVFAFNAYVSYRERGVVEPYDVPAAIAFLVAAILAWRRSLAAIVGGAVLCVIYLASVVTSGPAVFIAYWIVALILIVQTLPLLRRPAANST